MSGNIFNRLIERGVSKLTPKVGMGVTEILEHDRRPFEITRVEEKNGKIARFWMKPCDYKTKYFSDDNLEVGAVRQDALEIECKQNRRGQWCIVMDCLSEKTGRQYRGIAGVGGSIFVVLMPDGMKGEAYRCPEI